MSLEADVKRMALTPPFSALPREALQLLAFSCGKRALQSGESLFAAKDGADGAYFVLEGEIILSTNAGERRVGPGALIGETALLTSRERGATAKAAEDSKLLHVPRSTFLRVLGEFPEAATKVRKLAQARTRALIEAIDAVRVAHFEA